MKTYAKPTINKILIDNNINLLLQSPGNEGNGNGNGNGNGGDNGNGNGKPFGVSPFPDTPFNENSFK